MKKFTVLAILPLITSLLGCSNGAKEVPQDTVCAFSNGDDAKGCTPGHLAWFKPNSWGNEQLPLLAAAQYCDFNHPVVMNNSGVVCVFREKNVKASEATAAKK